MRSTILILLALTSIVQAQQPWPARVAEAKFDEVRTNTLPLELRTALLGRADFHRDFTLPELLHVWRIDLNADGTDEFIVQSNERYSGGPMMFVYERRADRFVEIGDTQGVIYLGPRVNGYFQIVSQSRGGGGTYTRILHRYERGSYRVVRIADYVQSGGTLRFVKERGLKLEPARVPVDVLVIVSAERPSEN